MSRDIITISLVYFVFIIRNFIIILQMNFEQSKAATIMGMMYF